MGYKITDTREMSRMTPAGSVVLTYRVWLVTDRGSTGTVDVPKDKWYKEYLLNILDQRAEELDLAHTVTE